MTVSSEQSRVQYATDGVATTFPVPFRFLSAQHLRVSFAQGDDDAVELVLGHDFDAVGAGNPSGGTVTTYTAYQTGGSIAIERVVPITQETAYQRNDPFPERAHEQALDKLTMICQMLGSFFGLTPGSIKRALMLGENDRDGRGAYRARNNRITALGDPQTETDAVNQRTMFSFVTSYVDRAIAGVSGGFGWFLQIGVGAIYRTFQEKMRDSVSVTDFGVLGDGTDESVSLQKAADSGHKTLLLPHGKTGIYKFSNVDFKGVALHSDVGATLDGVPINAGRLSGVVVASNRVSEKTEGILPQPQFSGGFVVKYRSMAEEGDDAYYVITKSSARDEYVAIRVRASPAADTGPWELQRAQSVFSLWDAYAYQSVLPGRAVDASYTGLGWEDFRVTPSVLGMETGTTGGPENTAFMARRTSVQSESVTILARPDERGNIKLSFLKSSNMSREVLIEYADKAETFSLVEPGASGPSIYTITLNVRSPGAVPITITQKDTGRYLTFVAVQADRPHQVRNNVAYDAWSYYVMPSYRSPVVNPGAQEYAIRDMDAIPPSFVGSYHGREVALDPHKWIIDGATTSFTKNVPIAATRGILLEQHTRISDKLETWSDYLFGDGSTSFSCDIQGEMRSSTVYLGMALPQLYNSTFDKPCYTEVLYPRRIDVATPGRYALGNTEMVVWRNATTGARVTAWVRSFTGYASMNGGASIESSIGNTSYAKLRTGMQQDAENKFRGASFQLVTVYS